MDPLEAGLAAIADPRPEVNEQAFDLLYECAFGRTGELTWTAAVRIAPRLIAPAMAGNPWAAILLLQIVAAARRDGHRKVVDAAASLALADLAGVAPRVRPVLELALQLAIGGPLPATSTIDAVVDAAVPAAGRDPA